MRGSLAWGRQKAVPGDPHWEPFTPAFHANLWIARWLAELAGRPAPGDQAPPLILDVGANQSVLYRMLRRLMNSGGLSEHTIDLERDRSVYDGAPNPFRVRADLGKVNNAGALVVNEATDSLARAYVEGNRSAEPAW